MIKIRSTLNGPIEFSVKSGNIKILRSKIQNKPEFLTEITEAQYKELLADKTGPFKDLLKSGDLQVIKDHDDQEESENRAFSMEELESHAASVLKEYKEGEGAELLNSSLVKVKEQLVTEFDEILSSGKSKAVEDAKTSFEAEAKTILDKAVEKAVSELKATLVKRHNSEFSSGKVKKWS